MTILYAATDKTMETLTVGWECKNTLKGQVFRTSMNEPAARLAEVSRGIAFAVEKLSLDTRRIVIACPNIDIIRNLQLCQKEWPSRNWKNQKGGDISNIATWKEIGTSLERLRKSGLALTYRALSSSSRQDQDYFSAISTLQTHLSKRTTKAPVDIRKFDWIVE